MSTAASMLPSSQRPVPMRMRPDLKVVRVPYQRTPSWVVKDPVALKYFRFQAEQFKILELLDGKRSLEQVRDAFQVEFPSSHLTLEEIQSLVSDLYKSGLVLSERYGQGQALLKLREENFRQKVWKTIQNILYVRLPGWDPDRTLAAMLPFTRWIFQPIGFFLWTVTFLSASLLLLVEFDEFQRRIPEFQQFFGWQNILSMWFIMGGAKVLHEFGHGLSCKHYGGECHEMGMMLLVLSPALYCDVSDSWLLKNKWARIMIGAAGMYVEVFLSSLAVFGWYFSEPGWFHHACLNLFFVSTISTVIFNANPLMRYDGYYMLSDYLEIPNLRPKADKMLREKFAWHCMGIESRPDPFMPQTGQHWFVLFAIAAWCYKWVIMFAILLFFYSCLKPYELQSLGIALAVFSLVSMVGSLVWGVWKLVSAPRRDPLSKTKITVSLTLLATAVGLALMVPFPWSLEAGLVIEPHEVAHVYTITPGELVEVNARPEQKVAAGDVIARLDNFEKQQQYAHLKRERDVQIKEIEVLHLLEEPARRRLAEEKLETIEEQIADYEDQLAKLTLVAPISGTVVEAPRTPAAMLDNMRTQLPRWHGTPLSPRNLGAMLEPRVHILSIAPDDRYQAVLVIDQADRNDIRVGGEVRIKLDDLPDKVFKGTVAEIGERHLELAPQPLTNKAGGDLPTVTDKEGRERLTSIAYQATVLLDEDAKLLKSGMRGRARFLVAKRSLGDWAWRYIRQTLNFRI